MSWRYYKVADGREFCYDVHPAFRCPMASRDERSYAVEQAAEALGMDPAKLARMIERGHRTGSHLRERVDGKLTDRCASCGHRLERLGFRCWIERPYTPEELNGGDGLPRLTRELNMALSGSEPNKTIKTFYVDTRREAREWALEEYKAAQAALSEAGG